MSGRPTKVLFLAVGDRHSPGTRLRALAYVPFLERRGFRVEVRFPLGPDPNRVRRRRILRPLELVRDLAAAARSDLVVVYRKTFPGVSARLLRGIARRVIYEFDDAIYLPSPSEPQGQRAEARYRRNFEATVRVADLVIAGNRHLAAEVVNRPTEILPTGVDLSLFKPRPVRTQVSGCVFGWIGTAENLAQWQRLLPVFKRIIAVDPTVRFKVVSNHRPPECDLPVDFERFSLAREAACLDDFDVGLMPLEDTPWCRGKCSCKALQCMAMGQPVVLSPVGMNREVVEAGVSGAFATTEEEWVAELLRLAGDLELRSKMGRAARAVVERSYSLERIGSRMADLVANLLG